MKPQTKQMTVYRQDKLLHLVKNEKRLLKEVCDDIYLSQVMNCLWRTAKGEIHTETERLKCPVVISKQKLLTALFFPVLFNLFTMSQKGAAYSVEPFFIINLSNEFQRTVIMRSLKTITGDFQLHLHKLPC